MLAINLYYSNFLRGLIRRLRKVSLGVALAASALSIVATLVRARLGFDAAFCEASLLPL
jgi:hypothetical protein